MVQYGHFAHLWTCFRSDSHFFCLVFYRLQPDNRDFNRGAWTYITQNSDILNWYVNLLKFRPKLPSRPVFVTWNFTIRFDYFFVCATMWNRSQVQPQILYRHVSIPLTQPDRRPYSYDFSGDTQWWSTVNSILWVSVQLCFIYSQDPYTFFPCIIAWLLQGARASLRNIIKVSGNRRKRWYRSLDCQKTLSENFFSGTHLTFSRCCTIIK